MLLLNKSAVRSWSGLAQSLGRRKLAPMHNGALVPASAGHRSSESQRISSASFHHLSRYLSKRRPESEPLKFDVSGPLAKAADGLLSSQQRILRQLGVGNNKIRSTNSLPTPRQKRKASFRKRRQDSLAEFHEQRTNTRRNPYPFYHDGVRVRVKSVHAAQTIDIVSVLSKVFGVSSASPPVRHRFGKSSVTIELPAEDEDGPSPFVSVFRFGSVVFFNFSPREAGSLLETIKKHATEPVAAGFERKEHFDIVINEHVAEDDGMPVVNGDYCVVPSLEMNSVAVVSQIMAQTTALDSYSDIADELLVNFASINSIVTRTGNFTDMEKNSLFRVVAQNNSIFIDMTSKLGIKDRSYTSWNLSQYERIHVGLKEEFEIDDRFENIEFKLDMIQQNAKFFLEILHNQKSNSLEWIIIVLIGFECVLMVLDMTGTGSTVFAALPSLSFLPTPKV